METQEKSGEQLADENRRLGLRAAVSFEELTPRYKGFSEAFRDLGIAQPKPDYRSLSATSSVAYIETLVSVVKQAKSKISKRKESELKPKAECG